MSSGGFDFLLGRLIHMAAHQMSLGRTEAEIEASLYGYASELDPVTVGTALVSAREAIRAGQLLTAGDTLGAETAAESAAIRGTGGYRMLVRVRTGPGEEDWRSIIATAPTDAGPQGLADWARSAAGQLLAREQYARAGGQEPEYTVAYLVPTI